MDQRMRLPCCGTPAIKIPTKRVLRNKKKESLKQKYETDDNKPCLCKEKIWDSKNQTSNTKTSTDATMYTFTYLEPVNSNNYINGNVNDNVTNEVTNDVTDDVSDANNDGVIEMVTDFTTDVATDKVTNVSIAGVTNVASDIVTYIDINGDNDQVTDAIADEVIDVVTEEIDKVVEEDADITSLSGITTTEENINPDKSIIKYRHVGDLQRSYDTLQQNENKPDDSNNSDYEHVPDDSALKQLVSYVYLKNYKNEDIGIKPKTEAIKNLMRQKEAVANTKVLNKAKTVKPNFAKQQTKRQRLKAARKLVPLSKYDIKHNRIEDQGPLDDSSLKTNRETSKDISSDDSYFETKLNSIKNMPFNDLGHDRRFKE